MVPANHDLWDWNANLPSQYPRHVQTDEGPFQATAVQWFWHPCPGRVHQCRGFRAPDTCKQLARKIWTHCPSLPFPCWSERPDLSIWNGNYSISKFDSFGYSFYLFSKTSHFLKSNKDIVINNKRNFNRQVTVTRTYLAAEKNL